MKAQLFKRSSLALAVAGAAAVPMHSWADTLLDGASDIVTLRKAPGDYKLSGFDSYALPNGDYVVVWTENNSAAVQDATTQDRLLLQLVGRDGQPNGEPRVLAEQQAGSTSEAFQHPAVVADADGQLVIAWEVRTRSQQIGNLCEFVGDELRGLTVAPPYTSVIALPVPSDFGDSPCGIELDIDDDGDFVMAWANHYFSEAEGENRYRLSLQSYQSGGVINSGGLRLEEPIAAVQPYTSSQRDRPIRTALQDNQTLLVAWETADGNVHAQRYDLQANKTGAAIDLGDSSIGTFGVNPDANNGFTAYWTEVESSAYVLNFRGIAGDGTLTDAHEIIRRDANPGSDGINSPAVEADASGNLFAAWTHLFGGSSRSMLVSAVDAQGDALSGGQGEFEKVDIQGEQKVAINDAVIGVTWANSGDHLFTRSLPALPQVEGSTDTDTNAGSSASGGGSGHPLWLLLAGLLAFGRRFKSFM